MFKLLKSLLLLPGPKYTWKKVILLLTLSCVCFSGSGVGGYCVYLYILHLQAVSATAKILAIVQTSPQKGPPLQTTHLAEILGLSCDSPASLGAFDLDNAKNCLLATGVIQDAQLKKIKPNTLFIQYTLRTPCFFLEDFTNTAMDQEGYFFPYAPFLSPRLLPKVYLGAIRPQNPWNTKLEPQLLTLTHTLFEGLGPANIEKIDLSQAEAQSAGKREIIVLIKGGTILRMSSKNVSEQIQNYIALKDKFLREPGSIIDLRLPGIAYIQNSLNGL